MMSSTRTTAWIWQTDDCEQLLYPIKKRAGLTDDPSEVRTTIHSALAVTGSSSATSTERSLAAGANCRRSPLHPYWPPGFTGALPRVSRLGSGNPKMASKPAAGPSPLWDVGFS